MHPGRSDFSYTYFRQLLHVLRGHFEARSLGEVPELLQSENRSSTLFLRHDIKLSLSRALPMAEIEHEYDLPATYMVRSDSPLYSLNERQARVQLLELIQMGHEVGLHFDLPGAEQQSQSFMRIITIKLHVACDQLEQIICRPVRTVSFQRPIPLVFRGPLQIDGRVNADAGALRAWCVSDIGGKWRESEPLATLSRPQGPALQMILHPIWWGEHNVAAPRRLQEFFDIATSHKLPREASVFDIHLAKTLPAVRREGILALASGGAR
jgi:hypothetical protein